jgi:prepilin-type N-terminal cleavage/methylation domain-containing protein/prepilin-type processing-associated H-X9-DG protein
MKRKVAAMKRRGSGFTLIELLVVVSIIALLISILLPSLNKARDQSRLVVCMSNLKQIGMGFTLYGDDHAQQPPPNRQKMDAGAPYGGTPPDFKDSDWWYYNHMVPRFIPSREKSGTNAAFGGVFRCPADKIAGRAYSMNIFASNYDQSKPFATTYSRGVTFNPFSVKSPQLYLLFGEAHAIFADSSNPNWYGTRYVIGMEGSSVYRKFMKATESAQLGPFSGYIDFKKHKQRANFLFADQHVETLRTTQVVKPDEANPTRWISTLRVQWSPEDPQWNLPTPQ